MPKVSVFDMTGKQIGERTLSEAVFGITPNQAVLHEVVKNYLANQRQGTQSTLTRTEVRGGGRKPWRQKGTGRARQGSTRSPQWTHGGIALGPKPRSYRYTINKKTRILGLKSALSAKVQSGNLIVIDDIKVEEYKTKQVVSFLSAIQAGQKPMILTLDADQKLVRSAGNIPGVVTSVVGAISTYDILNADKLVVSAAAVDKLEEVYAK